MDPETERCIETLGHRATHKTGRSLQNGTLCVFCRVFRLLYTARGLYHKQEICINITAAFTSQAANVMGCVCGDGLSLVAGSCPSPLHHWKASEHNIQIAAEL